jgi:hypothetical protein
VSNPICTDVRKTQSGTCPVEPQNEENDSLVLRGAGSLRRFLGVNGIDSLSRAMGFILICIGAQFAINGVRDLALDVDFWKQYPSAIPFSSLMFWPPSDSICSFRSRETNIPTFSVDAVALLTNVIAGLR